jgi:hypothetical protein
VAAAGTPDLPPATRLPHDTLRLGLPAAALGSIDDESSMEVALLVAAALLLATSGAGGLVIGLSTRRIVRGA